MNTKSQAAYKTVLEWIQVNVCDLDPASFMSDFEPALRNAIMEVYPACQIRGCYFHFVQAVRRNMAKLSELYKIITSDSDKRKLFHMFLALPLLPLGMIFEGFEHLVVEVAEFDEFKEFVDYFDNQWMRKVY